jgi:hypothetical protein
VEFGIQGANVGPNQDQILPSAIVPIIAIGLQRSKEEKDVYPGMLDAAIVNPAKTT